jgi:hypothetical protein
VCISVADPGCFIRDPDPIIFSSRIKDPDPNFFSVRDPGSYMKSGMQTTFFLLLMVSGAKSQSWSMVIIKMSGIRIRKKFIPDPEHWFALTN